LREHGLFERPENAGVTRGGVHRADEGDDEKRPEVLDDREAGARSGHQQRRGEEQPAS